MRWLSNVRLPIASPCGHGRGQRWRIGVDEEGRIAVVQPTPAGSAAGGDDWGGDWLSPMGVDLQINGGLGLAFPELTPTDLPQLEELLEQEQADGVSIAVWAADSARLKTARELLEEVLGEDDDDEEAIDGLEDDAEGDEG